MRSGSHEQLNMNNTIQKCIPKLKIAILQDTEPTIDSENGAQNKHI